MRAIVCDRVRGVARAGIVVRAGFDAALIDALVFEAGRTQGGADVQGVPQLPRDGRHSAGLVHDGIAGR